MHTPSRAFALLLVNTFIANLTTNFLWFAATFWVYLETRSVLATSIMGGAYMLLVAVVAVPFGMLVDRLRKKSVMVASQVLTAVSFAAALVCYHVFPHDRLLTIGAVPFWIFVAAVLFGGIAESAREIALPTTVTLLVPVEGRAKANGRVGIVNGLSFAVTSVFSGLALGLIGMGWTIVVAVVLSVLSLGHLVTIAVPEPAVQHAATAPRPVALGAAARTVVAIPGLLALIIFSTFNNLVGGVFLALLDPYGLTLMSVEAWGLLWGVVSFGFIIGGAVVATVGLGRKPLRLLLFGDVVIQLIGLLFTLRESVALLAAGLLLYMAVIPVVEAAEQTTLQRVVPYGLQGRVFGFAQAVETAAAPLTAFLIGPLAQYGLIPYMASDPGRRAFGWLVGAGEARGIALVFIGASSIGLLVTGLAFASRSYQVLSAEYAAGATEPGTG
ncbi:MFS transporter [Raineyella fluvialis]|uniref:MFS transporter n=1 Tax=Raineyella fluvialis TaxID=2662261 RepID=A0A5Q2FBQ8_9ACTN|nr:MFS transporter [Raineyella fluvialis]QGF23157.1 MFS transporter [Raineyella fluvialis]